MLEGSFKILDFKGKSLNLKYMFNVYNHNVSSTNQETAATVINANTSLLLTPGVFVFV